MNFIRLTLLFFKFAITLLATNDGRTRFQLCNYLEASVLYGKGHVGPTKVSFCDLGGYLLEIVGVINNNKERLISGTSVLTIPETMIQSNKIKIPDGSANILVDNSNGRIAVTTSTGTKKVVALRVIAIENTRSGTYTYTETAAPKSDLSDEIFGIDDDPFNMKSQFKACSHRKLKMKAFSGTTTSGEKIKDGVGEVEIVGNITGVDVFDVQNLVIAAADEKYGSLVAQFDHVLLCLPYGTVMTNSTGPDNYD